jgi:ankyrin repeat protein
MITVRVKSFWVVGLVAVSVLSVGGVRLQAGQKDVRRVRLPAYAEGSGEARQSAPGARRRQADRGADRRLVEAVKNGDKTAVAALIRQRANVNTPEADGTTALHWAVREDDLDLADMLVRAGADVKAANRYGVTAIYLACVNGSPAMIERLLKAGVDANAAGPEGETALMTAARTGKIEAARVLLDHGATIDARETWHGQTALMWAAAQRHPGMIRELIARGADVNARSNVERWERQTTAEPREKWLPLGSMTPLLFASREGCLDCAKVLVEAKANLNAADPDGITPTISALINGHYDVAAFLVEKGADVNLGDKTGRTPLYAAVDDHTMPYSNRPSPKETDNALTSFDVIKTLIAHNANVNVQLKAQQPYRTKVDRGADSVLTTGTTPLLRAAKAGDTTVVRFLLDKGADPKLVTRQGINPLMAAAGLGTKEEDGTGRQKTEADAIETIKLLLQAGVDVNAADTQNGRTAMHGAAQKGYDQIIRLLASNGGKLDVKDRRGLTPLDAAMGLLGNGGFDGSRADVHESTAAVIRELMAHQTASR